MKDLFIFSSVGSEHNICYKKKVFNSWQINEFDNGCVVFDKKDNFNYNRYFNNVVYHKGFKFPNLFYFLDLNKHIATNYKYIAVLDDDLLFDQNNTFYELIKIMNKFDLQICSISNSGKIKPSPYPLMRNDKTNKNELLICNFCESGFMVIESQFLTKFKDYYSLNLSELCTDWGMDFAICNFANDNICRIGIIKNMTFTNPIRKRKNVAYVNLDGMKNKYLKYNKPKIIIKHGI